MGLYIHIAGLESEESLTTFRLLVSEEELRTAEIREEKKEVKILRFEGGKEEKQREYRPLRSIR